MLFFQQSRENHPREQGRQLDRMGVGEGWREGTHGCLLIAYTEPLEKVGSKYFYFLIILKLMHIIQEAVL